MTNETPDFTTVTEVPGINATQSELSQIYTRYRWASDYVEGKKVLELACGSGPGLGYLKSKGASHVVGTDIEDGNLKYAREYYANRDGIETAIVDAMDLPYEDGSFDVVINFEAIYYIPDLVKALKEAHRVLTPGGVFLISTVNSKWHGFNPSPFSHEYPPADRLIELLTASGFEPEIKLGYVDQPAGIVRRLVGFIRIMAVKLKLIPDTMKAKEFLKRLFYGELSPVPYELEDGKYHEEPLSLLTDVRADEDKHVFIYALGKK
ncbi:MAG: class I SAM-dependent methyltransferase [Pseudomonadales bacterium]|nr:class I SAM-dependent methyltransferase [Pseudomonadales bacterium]